MRWGRELAGGLWPPSNETAEAESIELVNQLLRRLTAETEVGQEQEYEAERDDVPEPDPIDVLLEQFLAPGSSANRFGARAPVDRADLPRWMKLVCLALPAADAAHWMAELDSLLPGIVAIAPIVPDANGQPQGDEVAELVAEALGLAASKAPLAHVLHSGGDELELLPAADAAARYAEVLKGRYRDYLLAMDPHEELRRLVALDEALRSLFSYPLADPGSWWADFARRCDGVLRSKFAQVPGTRVAIPRGHYPPAAWGSAHGDVTDPNRDLMFAGESGSPARVLWVLRAAFEVGEFTEPGRVIFGS